MNAEQPGRVETGRATTAAKQTPRIARPTDSDARLAAELAAARVAAREPHVPLDHSPCSKRCQELDIPTLRYLGERHQQCPCRIDAGLPSPGAVV